MRYNTRPDMWNSVHRPIEYNLGYYNGTLALVGGGSLPTQSTFFLSSRAFRIAPSVGDELYVESGDYIGRHKIVSIVNSLAFVVDTTFTGGWLGSSVIRHLYNPTIRVYKGFKVTEPYPTELPFTLVASFIPEANTTGSADINLSGYLKNTFSIVPPVEGIDFNMFNGFRIGLYYPSIDVEYLDSPWRYMINAAIKSSVLNSEYTDKMRYLAPGIPLLFDCGPTILSYLTGTNVINEFYTAGAIPADGDYNDDYNNDFL